MTKNGFVVKVTSNDLFDDAVSDIVVCVDDMTFLSTKSDTKVIHSCQDLTLRKISLLDLILAFTQFFWSQTWLKGK